MIRKYPRTHHFPFSPGATSDDKVQKDWKSILENELVITEKLDGENNCITRDGVYSRSTVATTGAPWNAKTKEIWAGVRNCLGDLEIFGESVYAVHSIEYTNLKHPFYVFGIRLDNKFLSWQDVKTYCSALNLPTVPLVAKRKFSNEQELINLILDYMSRGSKLGGECEGVVVRNSQGFRTSGFSSNVLKYVRKNHVIEGSDHWTKNWKKANIKYP